VSDSGAYCLARGAEAIGTGDRARRTDDTCRRAPSIPYCGKACRPPPARIDPHQPEESPITETLLGFYGCLFPVGSFILGRQTYRQPDRKEQANKVATIKAPVLSVRQEAGGAAFTFTVNYTAVFDPDELNQRFLDCVELFERDTSSGDDPLTPEGCVDSGDFIASQAEVRRTKRVKLSDRRASTELGNEEIYAIVRLVGSTTGEQDTARTNELEVRT
jgi:hypothetical protein